MTHLVPLWISPEMISSGFWILMSARKWVALTGAGRPGILGKGRLNFVAVLTPRVGEFGFI